jgi:elongation factor Tu
VQDREYDIAGLLTRFSDTPVEKTNVWKTGIRPTFRVRVDFLDAETVSPGDSSVAVAVQFITPDAYPRCLAVGQRLDMHSGSHVVGFVEMTEVLNPALERLGS